MTLSYFCQPALVVHDSLQLGIPQFFAKRLSVTCADPVCIPVPLGHYPSVDPGLHATATSGSAFSSQHSKSSLFLSCAQKSMGADSIALDQKGEASFCLCCLCQVAALASMIKHFPFKLLAAGSAMAVPLQHHSHAQGTQCRDPLDLTALIASN